MALNAGFGWGCGPGSEAETASSNLAGERAAAQESIAEACSGAEHRQFDFWLGEWEVADTTGNVLGTNRITRVANGCGLHEYWRGGKGNNGNSLNWYEPAAGKWNQLWVGPGYYLRLSGGLEDGSMVLSGERETAQGRVVDRITWTPLADGRVRQLWEVSSDSGNTWGLVFEGFYIARI